MDKRELRREIFANSAARFKLPVVYVNQVGGNDSLVFDGAASPWTPSARVIASGASFREDLVIVDTATGAGRSARRPARRMRSRL